MASLAVAPNGAVTKAGQPSSEPPQPQQDSWARAWSPVASGEMRVVAIPLFVQTVLTLVGPLISLRPHGDPMNKALGHGM
jgi:hypothetical protein